MIERKVLHEQIVNEIKEYIFRNNLKPGDKVLNQREFCEMLGVSNASLREALRTLIAVDIIEVKNGKGIFVKQKNSIKIQTEISTENERESLLNLTELRRALEGAAVKMAAVRANQEDIDEMERNINAIRVKALRGECQPVEDKAFHYAIYAASKNPILIGIIENLNNAFDVIWQNPLGMEKAVNKEADLHVKLFEQIKAKNPAKAEKIFNKMMDEIELIIKNI